MRLVILLATNSGAPNINEVIAGLQGLTQEIHGLALLFNTLVLFSRVIKKRPD